MTRFCDNLHHVRSKPNNIKTIFQSVEDTKSGNQMDIILKTAVDNITLTISRKQTQNNALAAVIEVKVELAMTKESSDMGR